MDIKNIMTNKMIVIAVVAIVVISAIFVISSIGVCENCGAHTIVHNCRIGAFGFYEEGKLCGSCIESLEALGITVS